MLWWCDIYINPGGPYTADDYAYNEQEDLQINIARSKKIAVKWCDPLSLVSWTYETDILHEEFSILEDGETYCRGIIFKLSDVQPKQTNYERIKNMSIEEIAVSLMCPADIDETFTKPAHCKEENCCKCTLEWLESEVSNE